MTPDARGAGPVHVVERRTGGDVRWAVREVEAGDVPGARGRRCLIFVGEECVRRVWDYPGDWRALDDDALAALAWHR